MIAFNIFYKYIKLMGYLNLKSILILQKIDNKPIFYTVYI